ncbi:FtsK/SpoIIIE family DNA translocase [Clostridium sp. DL1XJH146]
MAKKANIQRNTKTKKTNSDIKGIIYITIGILMLLSIFFSNASGAFGEMTYRVLFSLLGFAAFIVPFILIFTGFIIILKKGKVKFSRRFYGLITVILNSMLFFQMVNVNEYYTKGDILNGIIKMYNFKTVFTGGILGYLIDIPLYNMFGQIGSYIVFVAIYFISIILIFEISLHNLLNNYYSKVKQKREESKNDKKIIVNESDKKEDGKNYIDNINKKIKILDFLKSEKGEKINNPIKEKEIPEFNDIVVNEVASEKISIIDQPQMEIKKVDIAEDSINVNKEIHSNYSNNKTNYSFPPIDLLKFNPFSKNQKSDKRELIGNANKLEKTLESFGVKAKVLQVTKGPSVTRFEIQPSIGVKVSKIVNLADDISLSLAASSVRIEAPIPGKSAVGIEIPNKEVSPVTLREVIDSEEFKDSIYNATIGLGKDIGGKCIVSDLSKMPHLLIAGATGSGKSVCINSLIISLLYKYTPEDIKLLLVDPKVVELNVYNGIPHLLIPVVTNPKKASGALHWAVKEMTRRYQMFADNNVRNIEGYNELYLREMVNEKLPWIVIIIDELADLMMVCASEVEESIGRLAQMARAAGMHLVIATQRPSVDVITGVIKANIPSRISFAVSSSIDSRTILDTSGAEKLLGKGDMLFYPVGASKPIRIQGAFISEDEVEKIVKYIKNSHDDTKYEEDIIEEINDNIDKSTSDQDELIDEAIKISIDLGQASTSLLQRKLRIGYNRAARIIDQMEENGVISGKNGSKPRQVLLDRYEK